MAWGAPPEWRGWVEHTPTRLPELSRRDDQEGVSIAVPGITMSQARRTRHGVAIERTSNESSALRRSGGSVCGEPGRRVEKGQSNKAC
jgi:hypothetical protein